MFPRAILPAIHGPNHADTLSLGRKVKARLARWKRGEYQQLWTEAIKATKPKPSRKKGRQPQGWSQDEYNGRRAASLAHDGQFTKALQALCSSGLAQNNQATLKEMQAKHPTPPSQSTFQPQTDTLQISFSKEQVVKAVRTFKRGTCPGPSGLRPEHLQVITKSAAPNRSDKFGDSLTKLVNTCTAGKVPVQVAPYLAGAKLFAANKKDGGKRPIAPGNLIRRLTSKCCNTAMAERAVALFGPHQLGVGVRGGLEAIVHAVRQAVDDWSEQGLGVLQVDFINAFNCADRDTAFREVEKHFPEIIQWVYTCYGVEAELVMGDHILLSKTGFHQGDQLAGLLFSTQSS